MARILGKIELDLNEPSQPRARSHLSLRADSSKWAAGGAPALSHTAEEEEEGTHIVYYCGSLDSHFHICFNRVSVRKFLKPPKNPVFFFSFLLLQEQRLRYLNQGGRSNPAQTQVCSTRPPIHSVTQCGVHSHCTAPRQTQTLVLWFSLKQRSCSG